MKVVVIGTGYVGLVSGVCLAAKDHDVTCVDVNSSIVDRLNRGEATIHETGLPELLGQVSAAGKFRATSALTDALDGCDIVLIAVGTPSSNGIIDLTFVRRVSAEIGAYLRTAGRHVSVIVKSTVVPGTTNSAVREEIERASGLSHGQFGLGMNPEFLREGEAIEDFLYPDRIVFGHEDSETLARLEELYAPWSVDKVRVNTATAELIKYANNALLATQISTMNEIANLAAAVGGIDARDVVEGVSLDKRWSPILPNGGRVRPAILSYLVPGCGFGGSCFPKDVQALRSQGEQLGLDMAVLNAVLSVNEAQPAQVGRLLADRLGSLEGVDVLLLGLAFKPGTDDVRESASLKIVADLLDRGARVTVHDPIASEAFLSALSGSASAPTVVTDWQSAVAWAHAVVIATAWDEYRALGGVDLSGKTVFDCRRQFSAADLVGADYLSIGLS